MGSTGERLAAERQAAMEDCIRSFFGAGSPNLLDVGSGDGRDLSHWIDRGWPADCLAGIDLVPERVAAAHRRVPNVDVRIGDGFSVPFDSDTFDVVTASTVFSSILDPDLRRALFEDIVRVLRPGGLILVYDFRIRKPTNRRVVAMTARRLEAMAPQPDRVIRLSPFLYAVALGEIVHPALGRLAMRLAPRTHFLASWQRPAVSGTTT